MAVEMNIYQKLAAIRGLVEVLEKDRQGFGYRYVSDSEILAKVTAGMKKYHLSLIPNIVPGTFEAQPISYIKRKVDKKTREVIEENVNEVICQSDMTFKWINNDNPEEYVDVAWALIGQQADASQAFGSGLTYCYRYFLLKYFGASTPDDDPDVWRSKQKEAALSEDKALAEEIIKEFDLEVKKFLAECPDKKDAVKSIVSKYVKSGDYFKISEPVLASRLFDEFRNYLEQKE